VQPKKELPYFGMLFSVWSMMSEMDASSSPMTPARWLENWRRLNPLALLGLAAVMGVLVADWNSAGISKGLIVVLVLAIGIVSWRRSVLSAVPLVFFGFMLVHVWSLQETFTHPLRQRLLAMPDRPALVGVIGRLYPWAEGAELDPSQALCVISEMRWGRTGLYQSIQARIKVVLPRGLILSEPGIYEIEGNLALPRPAQNPGQFDSASYALRSGWVTWVKADSVTLKKPEWWAPKFHLLQWAETSRQWISGALSRGIEAQEQNTAVLLAMALGASDAAGEEIEDAFRDSGTLHIFAVSGLHVVMLAAVAAFVLRWCGLSKGVAVFFLIAIVFGYAYITGWRPSAARAAFMITLVLAAPWWDRQASVQNSLGAAVLVLLAYDSHQLFMPGFQLSFGVLWAIAFFAPPMLGVVRPWTELDPFLPPALASHWQHFWADSRQWLASLCCVSLAAWIGSLPLMLGHFQTVTPVGLLANLFLVPISGISIGVSCASLVFAFLKLGSLQIIANALNAFLAWLMVALASWFSSLPFANFTLDLRFQKDPPPLELRVFHVSGGGAASYLRAMDQHWLLDTGNVRAWRGVVRPFLRHEGVDELDGVILSHGDMAHVGAASEAYRMGRPRLFSSVHEPWAFDPPFAAIPMLAKKVRVDSLSWHRLSADGRIEIQGGAQWPAYAEVLYPLHEDDAEKADDRGLVLMLHLGKLRVLWLADAGFITEKKLLERGVDLSCEVVVRGQHSADYSGLTEILVSAKPQILISSNDSRFPEETLPLRLRDYCLLHGIELFDLEVSGSVGIGITGAGAEAKAFRNGQSVSLETSSFKK
jgi:competence protein ComEC